MKRRYFLAASAGAAAHTRPRALSGANDAIRVACTGFRGRGGAHIRTILKTPGVELVALCDVDESVLNQRTKEVESAAKKRPATYTDFRKLLEDKSIDAVFIATPNHQHTLQTIWACQAGKDVYVEKPCSHNIFEARQIAAAASNYNRIVQHGTQSRSSPAIREAFQKVRDGLIGDVYMARGLCFKWRDTIGRTAPEPVPAGVHYDLWLGPAPKREFTRNRFHYNWHWFWDYGNGDIGNQGIHEMDIARWGLGVTYPSRVSAMGGHYMFDDDQETPNTMVATFEFDGTGKKKQLLVFEVRHWISNGESTVGGGRKTVKNSNSVGNLFYGSKGYLSVGDGPIQAFLGKEQEPQTLSTQESGGDTAHFTNFFDAMRSRKRSDLNSEIEEGAISTVLVHLANISYRLGRTLHFDSQTMRCAGDEEANRLFTRNYRAPFVVPRIA
jgi:predicted dehydrogenase